MPGSVDMSGPVSAGSAASGVNRVEPTLWEIGCTTWGRPAPEDSSRSLEPSDCLVGGIRDRNVFPYRTAV